MTKTPRHRRQSLWALLIATLVIGAGIVLFGDQVLLPALKSAPRGGAAPPQATASRARPQAEEGPALEDLQEVDRVSMRIGADRGGRIAAPGGAATIEIPPQALAGDTDVSLVRMVAPARGGGVHFAYDLRPDGLRLRRPAKLELVLPIGVDPGEAEIVTYDVPTSSWQPESDQDAASGGEFLTARLSHFSLRRVRIRPGMSFLAEANEGRATFYLEADAGNSFERYLEGRWQAVLPGSLRYRDLMRLGRLGRHNLIATGRLRAITGARPVPTVFRDERRTVAMPRGAPQARTGWVEIQRLDDEARPTGHRVVARVNDYGPGPRPRQAGVIIDLSRATMEALGLDWGHDFGLSSENPDLAFMRVPSTAASSSLHYLPVRVTAYDPQPPRVPSCRLR